jgi:hypothetical protein
MSSENKKNAYLSSHLGTFFTRLIELGMVPKKFCRLRIFFDIQFKITSKIFLPNVKVPSERFFYKVFESGRTF